MNSPTDSHLRIRAENLKKAGVVCVPVFKDESTRRKWASKVWDAMDDFPEYIQRGRRVQRVLGGFGALGNPSSFHHPTVRALRRKIKKHFAVPLFREYARVCHIEGARLESLFDRLCMRCKDFGAVGAESWHRDIYDGPKYGLPPLPSSLPNNRRDEVFGGWVNMSDEDQKFVCLLESHKGEAARLAQERGGGFASLSKQEMQDQRVEERLFAQRDRRLGSVRTDSDGKVVVPPGHAVVFFQRLLHAVHGGAQPDEPQLRCFMGYRLTTLDAPLFASSHAATLDNFAVPRIPSGQVPPMYSQNHYAQFSKSDSRFRTWAKRTFRDECLYHRNGYFTPGSKDNRNVSANKERYMPSLAEMGMGGAFPPYSEQDRNVLCPELL